MNNLLHYLSMGEENARTAKELMAPLRIGDVRTIAEIIHNLKVQENAIICACSKGYYLPSDRNDVLAIYRRTVNRINELQKTLPPMEEYLKCTE